MNGSLPTADVAIPDLAPLQRLLLTIGGIGLAISVVGAVIDVNRFLQSYLIAYMWCLGATLGCLAFGMMHQLSGGAWGVLIRRPIGAASRLLPLMAVLFVPILLGMTRLYPWTDPAVVAGDEALQHKHPYLNVPFFIIRAVLYFVIWNAISYVLNRWSVEQDRTGDPAIARRMQKMSAGGLVIYGITITFASFDWLMSLEPHWFSTIYGVLIMGGQGLTGLAVLIVMIVWLSRRPPLDRVVVPSHLQDLGNLLLAFVMLWAYFSFSQFLIIWAGNLPEEITWYYHRTATSWQVVGAVLIVVHFALPFVLLLSRVIKRHRTTLVRVAIVVLVARVIDLWWLVVPEFHHDGISLSWLDVLLPLSLATAWMGALVWQLRKRPILPIHDPQFDETLGAIIDHHYEQPGTVQ